MREPSRKTSSVDGTTSIERRDEENLYDLHNKTVINKTSQPDICLKMSRTCSGVQETKTLHITLIADFLLMPVALEKYRKRFFFVLTDLLFFEKRIKIRSTPLGVYTYGLITYTADGRTLCMC